MTTVVLHGDLGRKFGKTHEFDVRTPVEAIKALSANFKGFRQYLQEHSAPGYKIIVDKQEFSEPQLIYPVNKTINIIPVIAGSGGSVGKIILGVALVALSIYMPQLATTAFDVGAAAAGTAASTATVGAGWATVASIAGSLGTALVLGGVSELLFAPPKQSTNSVEESKNTNFDGPINITAQGVPVPLAYGKVLVGSVVVGSALYTSSFRDPNRLQSIGWSTYLATSADNTQLTITVANIESIVTKVQVITTTNAAETDPDAAGNTTYTYSRAGDFPTGNIQKTVAISTPLPTRYWIRMVTTEAVSATQGPFIVYAEYIQDTGGGG